jgi:hypothetical protein
VGKQDCHYMRSTASIANESDLPYASGKKLTWLP